MFKRRKRHPAVDESTPTVQPVKPVVYQGSVLLPEEGDAMRVTSAADINPNVRAHGTAGIPSGGAGGYGGAGTK